MRFAYWVKDLGMHAALTSPRTARLRRSCPNIPDDPEQRWSAYNHLGGGTMLVYPGLDGATVPLEQFGTPRDTHDGMVYYPPLTPPEPEDLIKPEKRRGIGVWYTTDSGRSLWIPCANASPRKVAFAINGGYKVLGWATEFAVLANEVWDDLDAISERIAKTGEMDVRISQLVRMAIQRAYNAPDELLEDVEWTWDSDQFPMLWHIMGYDPKDLAAAPSGSASSAPTTPTSP